MVVALGVPQSTLNRIGDRDERAPHRIYQRLYVVEILKGAEVRECEVCDQVYLVRPRFDFAPLQSLKHDARKEATETESLALGVVNPAPFAAGQVGSKELIREDVVFVAHSL